MYGACILWHSYCIVHAWCIVCACIVHLKCMHFTCTLRCFYCIVHVRCICSACIVRHIHSKVHALCGCFAADYMYRYCIMHVLCGCFIVKCMHFAGKAMHCACFLDAFCVGFDFYIHLRNQTNKHHGRQFFPLQLQAGGSPSRKVAARGQERPQIRYSIFELPH